MQELEFGQVYLTRSGSKVKLDGPVLGDANKWYVADWWNGSWAHLDSTIHLGELKERLFDEEDKPSSPLSGI